MSDHDEVPDLSAEAKRFLERHERTGEPSASGLERVQQRLAAQTQAAAPTRLRKRRPLVPPEVTAAAAVVALVLGVQVIYLAFRAEPVASPPPAAEPLVLDADAKALLTSWRAGDLEGARRLASKDCSSGACRSLASDLNRALGLAGRLDSLSPGELDELAALDRKLAEGGETALGGLVAQRQRGAQDSNLSTAGNSEADALFAEAQQERAKKNFERAVVRLEKCIKVAPAYAPCRRLAGSVYAAIATRDQSAADMEKARRHYEGYLEVAPADDEYVPKVRAILQAASAVPQETNVVADRVDVTPGQALELTLAHDLTRLAVGDPSVADISIVGGKVRVVGVSPGKTTLLVWLSNGTRESRLIVVEPARELAPKLFAEAQRARAEGDWVRAVGLARRVLANDRNHAGAAALMREALPRAREAYLRGYQLREQRPEEAIELFRLAASLTDEGDDTHQKALVRLEELEPEDAL